MQNWTTKMIMALFQQSGTNTESSVTSDEIEKKYQLNPQDSMTFKVGRDTYKLDFKGQRYCNKKKKKSIFLKSPLD